MSQTQPFSIPLSSTRLIAQDQQFRSRIAGLFCATDALFRFFSLGILFTIFAPLVSELSFFVLAERIGGILISGMSLFLLWIGGSSWRKLAIVLPWIMVVAVASSVHELVLLGGVWLYLILAGHLLFCLTLTLTLFRRLSRQQTALVAVFFIASYSVIGLFTTVLAVWNWYAVG